MCPKLRLIADQQAARAGLSILRASPRSGADGEQIRALGRRGMMAGRGREAGNTASDWALLSGYPRDGAPDTFAAM